jgi:hypothetical protein|tara:strand:- start:1238 stop:1663 length:426 start_codon:yes stop_codon:yes gene_type:complete
MAITSTICTSFKQEILVEGHNLTQGADSIKLALYTSSATLGASTTAFATTNQVTGTNYSSGGGTLTNVTPSTSGTTAICDFADFTFSTATVTARGCLLYNSTNSNKALCAIDFGGDKTSTAGDFTIVFPSPTATGAIIRLA